MKCQRAQQRLMAYHDKELSSGAARRLEKHLESCEECPKLLENLRLADQQISQAKGVHQVMGVPDMPPPGDRYWESFTARVLDRVEEDAATRAPERKRSKRSWDIFIPRMVPAFSVALVVVVAAGVLMKVGDLVPIPKAPAPAIKAVQEEGAASDESVVLTAEPASEKKELLKDTRDGELPGVVSSVPAGDDDAYRSAPSDVPAAGRAEAERKALAQAEAERQAQAQAKAERQAQAQAEAERQAQAQAEAERQAQAQAEAERQAQAQAEAERQAQVQAEAERQAQVKAEAERQAQVQAEAERQAQAQAKAERQAIAQAETERRAQAQAKAERRAQAQAEAERQAIAKAEAERQALERLEADRARERAAQAREKAEVLEETTADKNDSVAEAAGLFAADDMAPNRLNETTASLTADEPPRPGKLDGGVKVSAPAEPLMGTESVPVETMTAPKPRQPRTAGQSFGSRLPYRGPEDQLVHAKSLAEVRKFWESEQVLKNLLSQKPPQPIQEEASILLVRVLSSQNRIGEAQQVLDDAKGQFPANEMIQTFEFDTEEGRPVQ